MSDLMNEIGKQTAGNNLNEISVADIIVDKIRSLLIYIRIHGVLISIFGALGMLLGIGYSVITKPTYKALVTFVLEDSKSSGGIGQYAGLAALAGINLGSGGGGIFQGDNIVELYKSRSMIEKTLLSTCDFNGKKELLINRFIDYNSLRSKATGDSKIGMVDFHGDASNFNRLQDSIVTKIVDLINEKYLTVSKLDKKLDIITVEMISKDELFSKYFAENIVQVVNDFYIQTKTKKVNLNVQILQHQVDSVKRILNSSISGVASAMDLDPNANPFVVSLKVPSQKKQLDVQANTAIYSELVKNLELAKISVRQEMPLIQIIDKPVLPLIINKVVKVKAAVIGILVGVFLYVLYAMFSSLFTMIKKQPIN